MEIYIKLEHFNFTIQILTKEIVVQSIQELKIPTNKIFYDKKTEVLSIYLLDIVFVGTYKKSTKLARVLDDIFNSLEDSSLSRENLSVVEFVTGTPISEKTPLKKLTLISKKQAEEPKKEKKKEIIEDQKEKRDYSKAKKKGKRLAAPKPQAKAMDYEEEEEPMLDEIREEIKESRMMPAATPPPPPGAPSQPPVLKTPVSSVADLPDAFDKEEEKKVKPITTTYNINMGLQYYSVMMEQTSYLFYVYLSHKELKIVDEEGKTVFETSFTITTTKKEPPVLNMRVEGEGFEVHPLFGKVVVKKDAINPPVMIFSVLPVKKKEKRTKKEKKEGERRHLHVYVEFEENVINHSILSVIVQPKHFHLDIGPLHLDVSKRTAMIISFVSILIAVVSLIYTIFSWDASSTAVDIVSNFAPGMGSILFIGVFLYTLFKEGLYPIKEKISYFLNFDKSGALIK